MHLKILFILVYIREVILDGNVDHFWNEIMIFRNGYKVEFKLAIFKLKF